MEVGDDVFFRILEDWAQQRSGKAVSTRQFIALADCRTSPRRLRGPRRRAPRRGFSRS